MSSTIERKVKKKPVMVHRPKKVVNSKEKSLHRSMLSHSRIAAGYKKKIAALLGNNKALAHALELAHIELSNRDKLTVELQRRLTLQSPKRFKAKLQKVCEHLHIIVALLQDVLDDCGDVTDSNLVSFNLQTSNCSSRPDIVNGGQEIESPSPERQGTNDLMNNNADINTTPFAILQPPSRLTTAAEMSAILEQSVLSTDENLPPILFPEDECEAIQVNSNVTTRPRSKSRSASLKSRSRGSKIPTESPQERNSTTATNLDNDSEPNNNDEFGMIESILASLSPSPPPPSVSPKPDPSPKRSSPIKNFVEKSPCPVISKNNCLNDSNDDLLSSNNEKRVKRKSLSKRKSKKNILIVKLPHTPKQSHSLENMEETSTKEHLNSCTSKIPNRRKTFTVNKRKSIDKAFIPSKETADGDANQGPNSVPSKSCANKVLPSPDHNCHNENTNPAEDKRGKSDSDNKTGQQHFNSEVRIDGTCIIPQDMDLTCQSLLKEINAEKPVIGDLNDLSVNGTKPVSNALMYGYDPLEGTSKNKKSSILLKKPKSNKLSSKIPHSKTRPPELKPNSKPPVRKTNTKMCSSDTRTECINADTVQTSSTKSCSSPSHKFNSQGGNSQQEIFDLHEDCNAKGDQLEINADSNSPRSPSNCSPLNRLAKESKVLTRTEPIGDRKISSPLPLIKLNDIFTSAKSPSLANHCNNYVYIPDSLDGSVLKVDITPRKVAFKLENGSVMQESHSEEEKNFIPTEIVDISAPAEELFDGEMTRKRRGASSVTYKEPSLSKKLRQGDPFTSDIRNVQTSRMRKTKSNHSKKRKSRKCTVIKSYFEGSSDSDD